MKLTPAQVEKIEEVLTMIEDGHGHRAIVIKYGLQEITTFSGFSSVMRSLGVAVPVGGLRGTGRMSLQDKRAFLQWMRERKEAAE